MCHITEGMQVDPEPWPTQDMQSTVTHVGWEHLPILTSMQLSARNTQTHMAVYFLFEQGYFTLLGYPVTGHKDNSQM